MTYFKSDEELIDCPELSKLQFIICPGLVQTNVLHTACRRQKIIHSKFNHCSVLTITHRLCTVMNYDRILVMDNGRVTDFDTPHNLMKQSTGIFKQLASV